MLQDRQRALAALHERYAGVVFDKCLRMLGERNEAEDAVQETFVNAYRALDRFTYGESHLPWLYRIATNVCLKILRTRRRRPAEPLDDADSLGSAAPDVLTALRCRRILDRLLQSLDERSQEIFVAHFLDGMDQGEIAAMLGISRRAVVKRLTSLRARVARDPEVVRHG